MKHRRKSKRKKDDTCDVKGCDNEKKKSVSPGKVTKKTDLEIETTGHNAYLCKEHWKDYKKATKDEREMKRLNWD